MSPLKVLVPLDGSRTAEHSLTYLRPLTRFAELDVQLISVVDELEDFHGLSQSEASEREFNVLSTYLREVSHDIHKHLGLQVETKVLYGNPASCVLGAATRVKPDLILLSTHGRSGFSRWRIGSVADKLIRGRGLRRAGCRAASC